jgi:hypothetical protein
MRSPTSSKIDSRARAQARPTGCAVHRHTRTMRGREGGFFVPISRRNATRVIQSAEKYDQLARWGHRRGRTRKKIGHLGHVAIAVLRALLFRFQDFRTGQIDPAVETIAHHLGHSRSAVHDALNRLRKHGFLAWLRRYVETGMEGVRGPQVEQTSNAYQVLLPKALLIPGAPLPDDDSHRRQMEAESAERMLASLPLDELPGQIVTDNELSALLARLGRAVMAAERDPFNKDESQPKIKI